ncbi:MAG: CDP-alcohol phosphatidyltransferase family protein [Marivirga sp.]|nr:CDP-alcohol phosphatidyltransferase family protein [Marivirga sp.]
MHNHPIPYYVINGITFYRLLSAPVLLGLAYKGNLDIFKWLLAVSFFTDAIDGFLSRKFKVSSLFGAKLDSIADDATILVATLSLWIFKSEFIQGHWIPIVVLLSLFAIQNAVALIKYHKVTSFHTYLAKTAAVLQGCFFILFFFEAGMIEWLFYAAVAVTGMELIEEIFLVFALPEWKANVKGLFWVLNKRSIPVK